MTGWDPDGIVVSDGFVDYVEDLRERDDYGSGAVNARFSEPMAETPSDDDAQTHDENAVAAAASRDMSRRTFAAGVGAAAMAAAGAGGAAAQEAGQVPNFGGEYTPVPKVEDGRWRVDEHTAEMDQLDYVDNDGDVRSFTDEYGAVLEPAPEDSDETHNPVSFNASYIDSDEYTAFPRGVTREDADGDEEDVSALDAEEWTGDLLISDDGDALVLETDALADGATQSATFDNFEIDSGEARKVLQLVLDVDQLEADATATVEVVDASGASVAAEIDPAVDAAAESTIATSQGSGIVYQAEVGELGGSDLDTLDEIVVSVSDANAAFTIQGMNLELDSEWSFGTREVWDDEDEEVVEESLREPSGRTGIVSLTSLTNQFTDATIEAVEYDVEVLASEAPTSNFEATLEEVDRGSYDTEVQIVGALELPGGLYEVEVVEPGELVDEVRNPSDVYRTVEYAHDEAEIPTLEDVDDVSWTDATGVLEDGDTDEEVTLSTTVSAGDRIGLHYRLHEDEDLASGMVMSAGGGGAAALGGGDGNFLSTTIGKVSAVVTGAVAAIAIAFRRAGSSARNTVN